MAKRHAKRLSGGSRDEVLGSDDGDRKDVKYTEEFVLELQQELVKARLREAEATEHLKESNERQKGTSLYLLQVLIYDTKNSKDPRIKMVRQDNKLV